jgi:hypothetical protein
MHEQQRRYTDYLKRNGRGAPDALSSLHLHPSPMAVPRRPSTVTQRRRRRKANGTQRKATNNGQTPRRNQVRAIRTTNQPLSLSPHPKRNPLTKKKAEQNQTQSKTRTGHKLSSIIIKRRGPNNPEVRRIVSLHGEKNEVKSTSMSGSKKV